MFPGVSYKIIFSCPSSSTRDLFLISKGAPAKKSVRLFLEWILTDGQQFVKEAGYAQFKSNQIDTEKAKVK